MRIRSRFIQTGLLGALALVATLLMLVTSASAQLRYVQGNIDGKITAYEPPGGLTTTVTTFGGRACPVDPACAGRAYPFLATQPGLKPIRTEGAIVSGGTAVGDAVQVPLSNEWTLVTGGVLPGGVIPGVLSIQTFFIGGNDIATAGAGNGFSSGGGPGSHVLAPATAGYGGYTYQTFTFADATSPLGSTTTGVPINTITTTFGNLPAQPASILGANVTGGFRTYGGTAGLLVDTPNTLRLQFPTAEYLRTNGRCDPNAPFGNCKFGVQPGEGLQNRTSARRYQAQNTVGNFIVQHFRWFGDAWTTGTVSVVGGVGNNLTSFASSGTDQITTGGQRNLVLVTPYLAYGNGLDGSPDANGQIYRWEMTFVPEPMAGAGLAAGLGLLGALFFRSRKV